MQLFKFYPLLSFVLYLPVSLCRHVYFQLDLTRETSAPDGNPREMVLMNGQFPGPTLELNFGDTVEFQVYNNLPQSASIHFHGIEQMETPWSDGVPGVTQSPIEPGESFTYRWTATQYGTYWYHGHSRGLISDGLYGAILIKPSTWEPQPFSSISDDPDTLDAIKEAASNPQVMMISDWSKFTAEKYLTTEVESNLDIFCIDSILVNGKGSVNCQAQDELEKMANPNLMNILRKSNLTISDKGCTPMSPKALTQGDFNFTDPSKVPHGMQEGCEATQGSMETFTVDGSAGWVNFELIGAVNSKAVVFSIDQHPIWVYAVDGSYIHPQLADSLLMYNGERFSVMVQLNQTPGDYTIRIANSLPDQVISGFAQMSYSGAEGGFNLSKPYINYGGVNTTESVRHLDENKLVPFNVPAPAVTADQTHILTMGRYGFNWQWTMSNSSTYSLDLEEKNPPHLFDPLSTTSDDPSLLRTFNDTWVDLVIEAVLGPQNPAQPPHPIHKHSNKGYLIGHGTGPWNWSSVADAMKEIPENFNLAGAPYRDSFTTPAILFDPAWVVVRYHVVNPGPFLLHCHIHTHLMGGMALVIMDGVDAWPNVPALYRYGNGI